MDVLVWFLARKVDIALITVHDLGPVNYVPCSPGYISTGYFHFVPNYFIPDGLKAQTSRNLYKHLIVRAHIAVHSNPPQFWLPRRLGASEIEGDTLILTMCHILCN